MDFFSEMVVEAAELVKVTHLSFFFQKKGFFEMEKSKDERNRLICISNKQKFPGKKTL